MKFQNFILGVKTAYRFEGIKMNVTAYMFRNILHEIHKERLFRQICTTLTHIDLTWSLCCNYGKRAWGSFWEGGHNLA